MEAVIGARDEHRAPKREWFGHPRGLAVLFATEMWERFSFYGMAALLVLYMVEYLFHPGKLEAVLGYDGVKAALESVFGPLERQPLASQVFGFYSGLVYLTPIAGGWLADRVLGRRRTVLIGAILMAAGHFMMAAEPLFFLALLTLILGNGAFKPNISTQVGGLYAPEDARRDRAYTIFYVGINVGAFFAPLVCGTLQEQFGWHAGFSAAGVGMVIGLAIYVFGWRWLPTDERSRAAQAHERRAPLDATQRRAVAALLLLSTVMIFFWATYDQISNTIVLWANEYTERAVSAFGMRAQIPTTWFLALNPLLIFLFTPALVRFWAWQSERGREPSILAKMVLGFCAVAVANLILAAAAWHVAPAKAGVTWLLGYFVVVTLGELYVVPIGLTLVSKMAPAQITSLMMGVWLATTFPGGVLAGWLGTFWSTMDKAKFFLMIAAVAAVGAAVLCSLSWSLRVLLADERTGTKTDG